MRKWFISLSCIVHNKTLVNYKETVDYLSVFLYFVSVCDPGWRKKTKPGEMGLFIKLHL